MKKERPIVNKIFERDIDLLLVEELRCDKEFLRIFLKKAHWPVNYIAVETYHSVYMANGEVDVEAVLTYRGGTKRVLLIEDKIDAVTQENQSGRYKENADEFLIDTNITQKALFLVAPEKYIQIHEKDKNIKDFKYRITYEELIAFFKKTPIDTRSQYKAELLEFAIGKQKRQNDKVEIPEITEFFKQLFEHTKKFPGLRLVGKIDKKSKNDEYWVSWYTKFKNVEIYWKADHGYIDIQVGKCPGREAEFQEKFGKKLFPNMEIKQASNSVVFRIQNDCWKMSFRESFEDNIQRVNHVLSYVCCIHDFVETLPKEVFQ